MSIAQQNLAEPAQLDWDVAFTSSKYQPPPPAIGPDGKPIVYFAQVVEVKDSDPDVDKVSGSPYLNKQIELKFVRSGTHDGTRLLTWASTRPFSRKNRTTGVLEPIKGNPNALAKFLLGAGLSAKPQTNSEYEAALKLTGGKVLGVTIDWRAYNKETGETVNGYLSFPEDPERPGQRKSILKAGDIVTERDFTGAVTGERPVKSEVLFANARIKYFQNPTPRVGR